MWAGPASAAIAKVALTGPLAVLIPFLIKYRLHAGPEALRLVGARGGWGDPGGHLCRLAGRAAT